MLAYAGEDDNGETEAEGCGYGVDYACEHVGLKALGVVGSHADLYGYTEYTAVGGDEGEEDSERLIERGGELLEDYLYHLYEGCNDEYEGYGLEILDV